MSSMCGVGRFSRARVDRHELDAMLDALDQWHADARGAWTAPGIGLGYLELATAETPAALPLYDAATGLAVTGDIRLDNRDELAAALDIDRNGTGTWSDSGVVLRAYQRWGERCAARLTGDFAFVIWDGPRQKLFGARDRFGVKPFYYWNAHGCFAWASAMKGLLALKGVDRTVNETWIGDYLHRIALERTDTLYRSILRLGPAHAITVSAEGLRTWQYWQLSDLPEVRFTKEGDYVEAFREAFVRAVRRRTQLPHQVGAELSGGLDSSGVSAVAHQLLRDSGRELLTFSQVRPDGPGDYGEMPDDARDAIDALCRHADITRTCFLTGEGGIIPAIEWAMRHFDEPPRNLVSMYNDSLYDAAAGRGVRVLLSGFGGNQAATDVGIGRLRELLRHGPWSELVRELWAVPRPLRFAARLLAHELMPADSSVSYGWFGRSILMEKLRHRTSQSAFAERIGMEQRTRQAARIQDAVAAAALRERIALLLHAPDVPLRLESAHVATAGRRIEYRYPLLDSDLLAVYYWAPPQLKWQHGIGRYLFRKALDPWLPREICWEDTARRSANPGNPRRRRRDLPELTARLEAIPSGSQFFRYADVSKLQTQHVDAGRFRSKRWRRDTELIMLLLLEGKLREAEGR